MTQLIASNQVTLTNVNDGAKGKDGVTYYPHAAYANKSKDIFYDSLPSFANSPGYQGALVSSVPENGAYKITTTGGTHVMKTFVGINGTSGKALWTIVRLKNTHSTNNLRLVFNGIGDGTVLNRSFPTIVIKPGEEYFFMKSGVARSDYDFIQIAFQSDSADKDLAFTLYEASFYNSSPFVNFSFVPNNHAYLGNYTDTLENASTDITKYNWSLTKGSDGKDGISVTNNIPSYVLSTSGTTAPTTGWSSSIPTLIKGRFLWTKNDLTLSDSTTKTSYFVTYIPNDGINGQTPVVHTAYSNSQNGAVDFSITDSTNRRFIGQYVDYSTTNSTDYTKYKWVDMVGTVNVGSDNYIVKSNKQWTNGSTAGTGITPTVIDSILHVETVTGNGNYLNFTWEGRSSQNIAYIEEQFNENDDFTITFWCKRIVGTGNPSIYIKPNMGYYLLSGKLNSTEFKPISYTGKWIKAYTINFHLGFKNAIGTFEFEKFKISKGNVITDWTESSKDIQSNIDSKADQLLTQNQLNLLLETQNLMTAEMRTKATAEQVDSLIASYNKYVSDEAVNKANVEAELIDNAERIEAFRKDFDDKMVQLDFVSNYMRVTDLGLEISANDGSSSLLIQKDRISMLSAGKEVMYISQGLIHIENGVFTKTLQIGNFRESQADGDPTTNVEIYVG